MTSQYLPDRHKWLMERPIAHRGLHQNPETPENSLAAFRAAMDAGYPIELDLQISADGELFVFHDRSLVRMSGVQGRLENATANDLRRLRLSKTDEPIPTLSEVLQFVDGAVPILIETKDYRHRYGKIEKPLLKLLDDYDGQFAVQSFDPQSLIWLKRHAPHICRGQLLHGFKALPQRSLTDPDFVACSIDDLNSPLIKSTASLLVLAWTIRTQSQLTKAPSVADNFIFDGHPTVFPLIKGTEQGDSTSQK